MADREIVKYQASMEKLTADFASDVNDVIEDMKTQLRNLSRGLDNSVGKLPIPPKATVKDIQKIIDDAIASETKSFKGFLDVKISIDFDEKTQKLKNWGTHFGGSFQKL